jgi:hypothetical protein
MVTSIATNERVCNKIRHNRKSPRSFGGADDSDLLDWHSS